jgi:hypothetical protein
MKNTNIYIKGTTFISNKYIKTVKNEITYMKLFFKDPPLVILKKSIHMKEISLGLMISIEKPYFKDSSFTRTKKTYYNVLINNNVIQLQIWNILQLLSGK